MKKMLKSLFIPFLLICLLACSNDPSASWDEPNNPTVDTPQTPDEPAHNYISISLGKACEKEEDIDSDYSSYAENEGNNAGVAKGFIYALKFMGPDYNSWNFNVSLEGNSSSETYISENSVSVSGYGSFLPLHIAENETAETIKITVVDGYYENVKGTLTLEILEKFNRNDMSNNLSFDNKTFLSKADIYFIRDTISNNSTVDYNLDFTNARFEFDKVPDLAFCVMGSSYTDYSYSDAYTETEIYNKIVEQGALVNIKSVILPNSVKEIGFFAFSHCYNMKMEKLPTNLKRINNSFVYCNSITINKIPDNVTSLFGDAFEFCNGLTQIELPKKLETFDTSEFKGCKNISQITIPSTVTRVVTHTGITYYSYSVSNENTILKSIDGCLYSKDGTILYKVPVSKDDYYYTVPSTVTKLSTGAFDGLKKLNTLNIPSSVVEAEGYAVYECKKLKTVNIDFSEKPDTWSDNWIYPSNDVTINYTGSSNDNSESEAVFSGTYTIKNNTQGQLKFSNGTLEFIYNGVTRNSYSYEVNGSVLKVTWDTSSGNFVGEFDIEKTENGYKLSKKDDVSLTWVATWSYNASTEVIEIYK